MMSHSLIFMSQVFLPIQADTWPRDNSNLTQVFQWASSKSMAKHDLIGLDDKENIRSVSRFTNK